MPLFSLIYSDYFSEYSGENGQFEVKCQDADSYQPIKIRYLCVVLMMSNPGGRFCVKWVIRVHSKWRKRFWNWRKNEKKYSRYPRFVSKLSFFTNFMVMESWKFIFVNSVTIYGCFSSKMERIHAITILGGLFREKKAF